MKIVGRNNNNGGYRSYGAPFRIADGTSANTACAYGYEVEARLEHRPPLDWNISANTERAPAIALSICPLLRHFQQ